MTQLDQARGEWWIYNRPDGILRFTFHDYERDWGWFADMPQDEARLFFAEGWRQVRPRRWWQRIGR